MPKFKVGDKVRILPPSYVVDSENSAWTGFKAEVLEAGLHGDFAVMLKPLSPRPDGLGLAAFAWTVDELELWPEPVQFHYETNMIAWLQSIEASLQKANNELLEWQALENEEQIQKTEDYIVDLTTIKSMAVQSIAAFQNGKESF